MKTPALLVILATMLMACEPELPVPFKVYRIKSGQHDSGMGTGLLQSEEFKFIARFNETAIYETRISENQWDINKLMGFADCNSRHHDNSARFGWRWLNGQLEIHAYAYVAGERVSEFIGTVKIDQDHTYSIKLFEDRYEFELDNYPVISIDRDQKCDQGIYYLLFPYFGGNEVAPHDIIIQIKTIY